MKGTSFNPETAQVSEISRRRLLDYADGFYELAKSYDGEFCPGECEDKQELLTERRLWESRQILKEHLRDVARVMTEVACQVLMVKPMEERAGRRLIRAMRGEGILLTNPGFLTDESGHSSLLVTMQSLREVKLSAEVAAAMMGVVLKRRLRPSDRSPAMVEADPHNFMLVEEPDFAAMTGYARATKEGETISGDHYAFWGEQNGRMVVLLSDGTGSGERAGADSERVLDLMEKLLEAGYDTDTAIHMTNTALYARGDEINHPTMDVCEIDLYSGICELRKAGAAATFLKQAKGTEQLLEGTLPLGIFQQLRLRTIHRTLEDGDYVIMVSDGVVDAFCNAAYEDTLGEIIGNLREQNPTAMANRILQAAVLSCGGRIMDDMTVLVTGVWKSGI